MQLAFASMQYRPPGWRSPSMNTFPRKLARLFAALCLSVAAVPLFAQSPDSIEDFVFPRDGASLVDEIYVLYGDNCGRPHPDTRAPLVTHGVDEIVVEIYLVEPESLICPAVVLPDTILAVPLGKLGKGTHSVKRRLMLRARDAQAYRPLDESIDTIVVGDTPNPAASGTWYDSATPGTGITINLLPKPSDDAAGTAVLFLATFDQGGAPLWLSGVGTFSDARLTLPLRRAGTPGSAPPDATAVFQYLGCSRARLSVTGMALGFPIGTVDLKQLTLTAGLSGCTPPATLPQDFD
jgi:hypothetical protein